MKDKSNCSKDVDADGGDDPPLLERVPGWTSPDADDLRGENEFKPTTLIRLLLKLRDLRLEKFPKDPGINFLTWFELKSSSSIVCKPS